MTTAPVLPLSLDAKLASGSALVVIDMQNDFCAEGGYIHATMGKDVSAAAGVVAPVQWLVDAARAAGVPVVWVRADYSQDRIPDSMRVKLQARGITADCCKPGTWGAEAFGVQARDGEPVVIKHTYSGFAGTGLHELLRPGLHTGVQARAIRTLVFCGVQTQVCVESSVRDAHSLGYFCVVPQDAVASHTPALHDATLTNIRFLFGDVCSVSEVQEGWSAKAG